MSLAAGAWESSGAVLAPIEEAVGHTLHWQQRRFLSRDSALGDGERLYAVFRWAGKWRIRAELRTATRVRVIRPEGFFHRRILVESPGEGRPEAVLQRGWFGRGTLRWADGSELEWRTDFWPRRRSFGTMGGSPVVTIRPGFAPFRARAAIELGRGTPPERLEALAGLAWYQVLMSRRRHAAAGAAS